MGKAFDVGFDKVAAKLGAGESPLTKMLKADYEKQKAIVGKSFEEFKQQKLDQFEFADGLDEKEEARKDEDEKKEERRRQEQYKELHKFDAALSGSAEAAARIAEQKDRQQTQLGLNDRKNTPLAPIQGAATGSAEALKVQSESKDLLKNINGGIQKIAGMRKKETEAANLAL